MSVEDNRARYLSQVLFFFFEKFVIPEYRGLSVKKSCFFTSLAFSPKRLKGFSYFLHECRGQWGASFEPDGFSERNLNPGLFGIKCLFFSLISKTALRIFLKFCMIVEDIRRTIKVLDLLQCKPTGVEGHSVIFLKVGS